MTPVPFVSSRAGCQAKLRELSLKVWQDRTTFKGDLQIYTITLDGSGKGNLMTEKVSGAFRSSPGLLSIRRFSGDFYVIGWGTGEEPSYLLANDCAAGSLSWMAVDPTRLSWHWVHRHRASR